MNTELLMWKARESIKKVKPGATFVGKHSNMSTKHK